MIPCANRCGNWAVAGYSVCANCFLTKTTTQSSTPLILPVMSARDMCAHVDSAGPAKYLFRELWPAGTYGVTAAEHKAGKTFMLGDAAISAASGTPFLNYFPTDTQGTVLLFFGEGGERNTIRRLRAITRSRGLELENLPIMMMCRAVKLGDEQEMNYYRNTIEYYRPVLVGIDPLYLSAGGANGADLYAMGGILSKAQEACVSTQSALLVSHHFNRNAAASGSGRISGAGPAEWGRVVLSNSVKSRRTEKGTKATTTVVRIDVIGGENPDMSYEMTRTVCADDPSDLNSALNYEVKVIEIGDDSDTTESGDEWSKGLSPAGKKVHEALKEGAADIQEIGNRIAKRHGTGLKRPTIQKELGALRKQNRADSLDGPHGNVWFLGKAGGADGADGMAAGAADGVP